ncbi:hypothetical protein GQR36_13995 [Enterococcus termitis]
MKKAILATLLSATALTLLAVPADAATKKLKLTLVFNLNQMIQPLNQV